MLVCPCTYNLFSMLLIFTMLCRMVGYYCHACLGRWTLEHFWMTRETVSKEASTLRVSLERQNTSMRQSVPVGKWVAIAVWWLANITSYSYVSQLFGVDYSTVAKIVVEVCLAIDLHLLRGNIRIRDVRETFLIIYLTKITIPYIIIIQPWNRFLCSRWCQDFRKKASQTA